jgi:uncharacterized protein YecT (DUF1311 family)
MHYFYLACVLLLNGRTDASAAGVGAAKADGSPTQEESGGGSSETAAVASRALAAATAKGLHGSGGALLSVEAQAAYCANEQKRYSRLLESVRRGEVPAVREEEAPRPEDPDVVLNRRYKSVLYWLNSGFGIPVQGTEQAAGDEREKLYFLKSDELKASQRAWIVFRDEHARLFRALNPKVDADDWLSWLTSQRVSEMNAWMRFPESVESIGKSATESPEVVKAVQALQSVMAFADTHTKLARILDMRVGRGRYNEFLDADWPPLKALLLQFLSKRQQDDYQKAVEKGQLVLKKKFAPTRKELDTLIAADEGGTLAIMEAGLLDIYAEQDRILQMKPFVKFMPVLLQAELMSLFAVLEKNGF